MSINNIATLIEQQVSKNGESNALYYKGQFYTYQELFEKAQIIAAKLQTFTGDRVVILQDRNDLAILAILGCVLAGKTFVPLNSSAPMTRNKKLVQQIKPACILGDFEDNGFALFELAPCCSITNVLTLNIRSKLKPLTNPVATVLFTSGSTGVPKAVPITHKNIIAYIHNFLQRYPLSAEDRFLQLTEVNFDPILHELFVCWAVGACVYVFPEHFIGGLDRFIRKHQLTVWTSVPATAQLLLKTCKPEQGALDTLKWSVFGGEVLSYEFCRAWNFAASNSHIVNCYGPSEATVAVITYCLSPDAVATTPKSGSCPVGKIFENMSVKLIDSQQIESNASGECWISGPQVVEGYWGLEEKTAESFVLDQGRKWYRTGDIMRCDEKENLVFSGRNDSQVKVRGYRVELLEVEDIVRRCSDTLSVAVVAVPLRPGAGLGQAALSIVAILSDTKLQPGEIIASCREQVPHYLVPDEIMILSELPRNINGKVDYKAIKELALEARCNPA